MINVAVPLTGLIFGCIICCTVMIGIICIVVCENIVEITKTLKEILKILKGDKPKEGEKSCVEKL